MYAIIKTGGKQYRVEQGQSLLVERLPASDGDSVSLQPFLVVDGSDVLFGDGLAGASVSARVVGHERGPKLRVVKFKPKRGYKRRTGHRQELTRIEVTEISRGGGGAGAGGARKRGRGAAKAAPAPVAAESAAPAAADSAAKEEATGDGA